MERIDRYAELITRVGANVQPGQTVYVTALVEHAPLVRALGRAGYTAGARFVDVRYADNHLRRSFIENAADEVLTETPSWLQTRTDALADGGALIMLAGDPEPELLADLDQERVGRARPIDAMQRQLRAQNERTVNWTIAAYPTPGQAVQVFGEPDLERLWEAVAHSVRLDEDDPVAAWRVHTDRLRTRREQLDGYGFDAIRFTGPGTDLSVGLHPRCALERRGARNRERHQARAESPHRGGLRVPRLAPHRRTRSLDAALAARRHDRPRSRDAVRRGQSGRGASLHW